MTAAVGQQEELLRKKGDDVYLPCQNVQTCDQIQWWFKAPWNPLLERIPLPGPGSTLSNRKMLREDCTLVLLGVQALDAGYYMCTLMEREVVQIYLAVLTSKYHSGLMGAGERCVHSLLSPKHCRPWLHLEVATPKISNKVGGTVL